MADETLPAFEDTVDPNELPKFEDTVDPNELPKFEDTVDHPAPKKQGWGEYLGRGATGAIPIAGGVAGAMVGSGAGPVGGVAGSGLGYAGGSELKDLLNQYLFGDKAQSTKPMDQLKRAISNTTNGAAQEMGGQVIGYGLSKLGQMLPKTAEKIAAMHLRPTPSMIRNIGKEGVESAAREALDAGAIKPFRKAQTTFDNLDDILEQVGKQKGDIVNSSGERLDPEATASRIEEEVIKPLRSQSSVAQPIADALQGKVDRFRKFHIPENATDIDPSGVPVKAIEQEKMDAMRNTKYGENTDLANQADKNYNRVLKEEVENKIDDPSFLALKKKYGNLTNAREMSNRTASLTNGGTGLMGHIGDKSLQTAALLRPDPVHIALVLARMLAKGKMGSAAATGLDAASKGIQSLSQPSNTVWQKALGRYMQGAQ